MGLDAGANSQPTRRTHSPLATFAQEVLAAAWITSVNVAAVVKFEWPWWAALPTAAPITLYLALVLTGRAHLGPRR